ncbi:MAG: hypothetical protein KAT43_06200 [Nanoarchaeota archaeon]|nr:hypothetical protein [Nanoarchaeota archaeon]
MRQVIITTIMFSLFSGCAIFPKKGGGYTKVNAKLKSSGNLAKGILNIVGTSLLTAVAASAVYSRVSNDQPVFTGGWDFVLGTFVTLIISAGTSNVYTCFKAKYEWEEVIEKIQESKKTNTTSTQWAFEDKGLLVQVKHRLSERID